MKAARAKPRRTRNGRSSVAHAVTRPGPPLRLVALRGALALSQEAMAQVLGASTRSVVRWEKGEVEPGRLVMERLDQVEDLRKRATRLFGPGAAGKWFRAPNQTLSGLTPLDRMRSPGGVQEVRDLLGRIEWGIPS